MEKNRKSISLTFDVDEYEEYFKEPLSGNYKEKLEKIFKGKEESKTSMLKAMVENPDKSDKELKYMLLTAGLGMLYGEIM